MPDNRPTIETAESIEQSGKQYSKIWMGQRLKRIGIGVGMVAFAVTLFLVQVNFTDTFGKHKYTMAERVITAPRDFEGLMSVGLVVIAFLIGIEMTVVQTTKLLIGPPRAGRTVEKTVRQLYTNVLFKWGTPFSNVDVAAFVYLRNEAKREIGEWTGFCDYWGRVNYEIVTLLETQSQQTVTRTRPEIKSVKTLSSTLERASYEVEINFSVISEKDINSSKTFGPYVYAAKGEAVRVGDRWYLSSGKWSGTPL